MFRLRDMKNGLYQIHKENEKHAYEGTPQSVFMQAVKWGVVQRELVAAVNELSNKGHDYADFNDYGRLKWTKKNS